MKCWRMYQIAITMIAGLLLFGCSESTPSPAEMDKSPFTGFPCAAPCWHGLLVGKSSESDVMSTLSKLSFIDKNSIYVHRMSMSTLKPSIEAQGAEITASCIHPHKACLTLSVADNLLTEVNILLNYEMRMDEAIQSLGDPDYIGYQLMGAERVTCEIDLVWINKQLILASDTFVGSKIYDNCAVVHDNRKMISNLSTSEVTYTSPEVINSLLSTRNGEFFEFSETIPEK